MTGDGVRGSVGGRPWSCIVGQEEGRVDDKEGGECNNRTMEMGISQSLLASHSSSSSGSVESDCHCVSSRGVLWCFFAIHNKSCNLTVMTRLNKTKINMFRCPVLTIKKAKNARMQILYLKKKKKKSVYYRESVNKLCS